MFYHICRKKLVYTNGYSFADRDLFTRYAAIGVGHDAMLLERHAYGLIDDNSPNDNDEDDVGDIEVLGLSHVSRNDRDVGEEDKYEDEQDEQDEEEDKDEDEDEADECGDRDEASHDSDFNTYF